MTRHTRTVTALASALLIATVAAGCSNGGGDNGSASGTDSGTDVTSREEADVLPAASSSAAPAVDVKNGKFGKMLVDEKGMTLYEFDKDTKNKSMCNGSCAAAWPPFTVKSKPAAGKGLKADLLSTTKRDDGSEQVTYNGRPLYRFEADKKAGDVNGQDVNAFGAKWFIMNPEGKKVTTQPQNNNGGGY
ncbi:hypothetical protein OIE71_03200 [Streptomyces sp. NBC_01725]|uniref:COG4315 family predicted lipoprotein n=1 Tax=Streptomyces sp. NBC_01725 TaxID=2975923 RepID=UPI002E2B9D30|nr:hypothetical protein [Streptomyces sp. NBC_01725]